MLWLGDLCVLCLCKLGMLSQTLELHFEHTGLEMSTAGTRQGVWYRQDWAKASRLPPSWVDGFIEPPVTKQPAAACTVIWPEDKILFNNCLTIMGVLQPCRPVKKAVHVLRWLFASLFLSVFLCRADHGCCMGTGGNLTVCPRSTLLVILQLRKR